MSNHKNPWRGDWDQYKDYDGIGYMKYTLQKIEEVPDLGGGNSNIFIFTPIFGEMIQFDDHIFQLGWDHQLVMNPAYDC